MVLEILEASDNRISIEKVYLNGLHALRRLTLLNTLNEEIKVKFDTTLGDQLTFQVENENFSDVQDIGGFDFVTNTAEFAQNVVCSRNTSNEMFNRVNLINEMDISANGRRTIVMLLLPDPSTGKQSKRTSMVGSDSSSQATTPSLSPGSSSTDYFALNNDNGVVRKLRKFNGEVHFQVFSESSSFTPLETKVIKLFTTCCESVFDTDIEDGGIDLSDCIVGGTYTKLFTLRNRSEIDLFWSIELFDANEEERGWLEFLNVETLRPIENDRIPPFSSRTIKMIFKPTQPAKLFLNLHIENTYNADNCLECPIHASVSSMQKEEMLFLMSGSSMDFGDCIAGSWTKQVLVLKNVSSSLLEAHFKAVDNVDVRFQLLLDDFNTLDDIPTSGTTTPAEAFPWGNDILGDTNLHISTPVSATAEVADASMSPVEVLASPRLYQVRSFGLITEGLKNERESRSIEPSSRATSRSSSVQRQDDVSLEGNEETKSTSAGSTTTDNSQAAINRRPERRRNLFSEDHVTQIEELFMRPGMTYRVAVSVRPKISKPLMDPKAGALSKKSFRILIKYGIPASRGGAKIPKETKTVHCRVRACTSLISVSPSVLDFGDLEVGTLSSLPLTVINESDMMAQVDVRFMSKIINMYRNEIRIPPRQSVEVKVDIYPRKVNSDYSKQITVANLLNRSNDQIVEVRSNNVDRTGVTLHSLFYRILTPTGANFIDFGNLILNSSTIRSFTIENLTNKKLVIDLTSTSSEEIVPYVKREESRDDVVNQADENVNEHLHVKTCSSASLSSTSSTRTEKGKLQLQPLSMLRPPNPAEIKEKVIESIIGNDRDILSRRIASEKNDKMANFQVDGKEDVFMAEPASSSNSFKQPMSTRDLIPALKKSNKRSNNSSGGSEFSSTDYLDLATPIAQDLTKRINGLQSKAIKFNERSRSRCHGQNDDNSGVITKKGVMVLPPPSLLFPQPTESNHTLTNTTPALTAKLPSLRHHMLGDFPDITKLNLDQFLSAMEYYGSMKFELRGVRSDSLPSPTLKNGGGSSSVLSSEEKYVRTMMSAQRELAALIEAEVIVPVNRVVLGPRQERKIIIVSRPLSSLRPHVQGLPKKQDARVFLRLAEYDEAILDAAMTASSIPKPSSMPVRKLMLRATMTRSIMEISQLHINFGYVDRSDRRTKTILVQNRSETPLFVAVRKSGSVASSDLLLAGGAHFVIPGFGKKEIEFVFSPSLSGPFQEKLVLENVWDRDNSQTVVIKANVRKVHTFYVDSGLEVDFGSMKVHTSDCTYSKSCHIIMSNTSKIGRTYEAHLEPFKLVYNLVGMDLEERYVIAAEVLMEETLSGNGKDAVLTKAEMEEVEHLEQKLKIAKRKGKDEKIKKLESRLGELGVVVMSSKSEGNNEEIEQIEDTKSNAVGGKGNTIMNVASKDKLRRLNENGVAFGLEAGQVKRLNVVIRAKLLPRTAMVGDKVGTGDEGFIHANRVDHALVEINCRLVVHEQRNKDDAREVQLRAKVCLDKDFDKILEGDAVNTANSRPTGAIVLGGGSLMDNL